MSVRQLVCYSIIKEEGMEHMCEYFQSELLLYSCKACLYPAEHLFAHRVLLSE